MLMDDSHPPNKAARRTPRLARWGLWCSTTDHRDRCLDSGKSSPSGLVLGTYQDKTYKGGGGGGEHTHIIERVN